MIQNDSSDNQILVKDLINTKTKDSLSEENISEQNSGDEKTTVVDNISNIKDIDKIKSHYENIISDILAQKHELEQEYKGLVIKEHLQKLNANAELLYLVMKGRGDLDKISYIDGTLKGLDIILTAYKKDENIAPLFTHNSKDKNDAQNDVYNKILKTKALNTSSETSKFEKEKERICSDWCSNK